MSLFSLNGRTAVITGASGAIGGAIARGFAEAGANLALTYNSNPARLEALADDLAAQGARPAVSQVDVQSESALRAHCAETLERFGGIDILVNCAGGNIKAAMTGGDTGFFNLDASAISETLNLNIMGGAVLPCLVYGPSIAKSRFGGSMINVTSMNAFRPLEGRPAYAAAKAAVNNFTQWLACHVAQNYSPEMRVNAIAPGFFPNERARLTLFEEDGSLSARGQRIVDLTPMARLGEVEDLIGTALWYASNASRYVTGTTTAVDGGFNAYSGV
ncbi:SDR family oxidoreductase [Martelella mediterranea]|uniref:SDR family oxidoreductase n=1 Tax=Martelella mediterranea TaxID=293089 RepID=UPI001E505B76|nr:SDR family oxidoreductase [Martelella mediterranea]MCD1636463.1 SDR family oxidoreductase [Martelella mediterranea]